MKNLKMYDLGELTAVFSTVDDVMSLTVVPRSRRGDLLAEKLDLSFIDKKFAHIKTQSLFQVHLQGDSAGRGFASGLTLKNSASAYAFKPVSQKLNRAADGATVRTVFENGSGLTGENTLVYREGINALECFCKLTNGSEKPVVVEMLDSFNVSNLSPFEAENDTDAMILHHMRSHWSGEGRLVSNTLTELSLEDSWSSYGNRIFRIGQTGSMPANGFLPFMALEDQKNGVTYAFSVEAPDSWQMEAHQFNGSVSFSGGRADRNFGQVAFELRPGESYTTDSAFLTAADGGLLAAAGRLTDYYSACSECIEGEDALPVIFNEYGYTWGQPSMDTLRPFIKAAAEYGVGYFVVDAGWYREEGKCWKSLGDWNVNERDFPNGFEEFTQEAAAHGMKPGVWFEFESVSDDSAAYRELYPYLLRRDGNVIRCGERAFLDFTRPEVRQYLRKKVIEPLRENGFGYIKVDYNENIGIGADGSVSPGDGLRRHIAGVLEFYEEIKNSVPGIVIEVCSSGGMRLEPKFMRLAGQMSFSDAHEGPEGAVIAGNLHRFMPPRKMQIWAVLKEEYSLCKTGFVIGTAMLGRYCLSGNILALSTGQKEMVAESMRFYREISPVIRDGDTVFLSQEGVTSYKNLRGCQILLRVSKDKKRAVLYAYSFDGEAREIELLELSAYRAVRAFGGGPVRIEDGFVRFAQTPEKNHCNIFLLERV